MHHNRTLFALLGRYSFVVLLFFIGACATNQTIPVNPSAVEIGFQGVLDSLLTSYPNAVGIMAHVEAPDRGISWSGAAGHPKRGSMNGIDPAQTAWIASNTKTYVSAAMLRLVEDEKIRLEDPIGPLLTDSTNAKFSRDGYDLEAIKVVHLLSHTSGIFDYVDAPIFFERAKENGQYRWTREEQLALSLSAGEPMAAAGAHFSYSDANYLLLTEIMEGLYKKPYYESMRKLIDYDRLGLHSTWFLSQEKKPETAKQLVTQYTGKYGLVTDEMDPSFDLYGGGGLASTTSDLARFSQALFSGRLFKNPNTIDLIYTHIETEDEEAANYSLGLSQSEVNGLTAYGHGGFWGTTVMYLPELNASISVFVLEKDEAALRQDVLEGLVDLF